MKNLNSCLNPIRKDVYFHRCYFLKSNFIFSNSTSACLARNLKDNNQQRDPVLKRAIQRLPPRCYRRPPLQQHGNSMEKLQHLVPSAYQFLQQPATSSVVIRTAPPPCAVGGGGDAVPPQHQGGGVSYENLLELQKAYMEGVWGAGVRTVSLSQVQGSGEEGSGNQLTTQSFAGTTNLATTETLAPTMHLLPNFVPATSFVTSTSSVSSTDIVPSTSFVPTTSFVPNASFVPNTTFVPSTNFVPTTNDVPTTNVVPTASPYETELKMEEEEGKVDDGDQDVDMIVERCVPIPFEIPHTTPTEAS